MKSRTSITLVAIIVLLSALSSARGQDPKAGPKAPEPITITAFGNKLIVSSEDPAALALASELVRILTKVPSGAGDLEIIGLRYANAVDTAKLLDELYNGPKPAAGGGKVFRGGGRGGFGGPDDEFGGPFAAAAAAASPREKRIRVVADPATNALLVQASPLDMLKIRALLANSLDTGNPESNALVKTYIIGPLKNAHAIDIAAILRDVYRESMNNNRRGIGQIDDPFTGNSRTPAPNMDSHGNAKGVTLSIGTDDKTNSLIVACTTTMYEEINKLVVQLESAAGSTKQTVKIVRVPGVDPALIQQALDAVQGRAAANRTSGGMGANRMGTPGAAGQMPGGGFPGGGFGPGFPGGNGFPNQGFTPGRGGFGPGGGGQGPNGPGGG
ncbi:MAG TPA: secretin N-terminal domain-containing protein [Gemmataceae bacterium]|jgi:type II secretory pathway component GspD/PulD (secretin)|nr:secretin N-terminal domain-containing protein [Gemmataceae bacterium]